MSRNQRSTIKCCNCGSMYTPVKEGTVYSFLLNPPNSGMFKLIAEESFKDNEGCSWSLHIYGSIREEWIRCNSYTFPHNFHLVDMILRIFETTDYTLLE